MAGGGVGEAALIQAALTGAAVGGGTAALTGGDPLKGALLGGITGGVGSGISGAFAGAAPAAAVPGAAGASAGAGAASSGIMGIAPEAAVTGLGASAPAGFSITPLSAAPEALTAYTPAVDSATALGAGAAPTASPAASGWTSGYDLPMGQPPAAKSGFVDPLKFVQKNPYIVGAAGLAGALGSRENVAMPGTEEYRGALSRFRFNPDTYQPADYSRYRAPGYAAGGIAGLDTPSLRSVPGPSMYRNPQQSFAAGGISQLGSYSDGGRMLKGPGDGMSDSIPASISGKRPARLADGEFVVSSDVVSGLGNGSTDAGARQLYSMMDRVRKARTGTKKQGREINPSKYLPA